MLSENMSVAQQNKGESSNAEQTERNSKQEIPYKII